MPVHDLGYRGWAEKRVPHILRVWVVALSGISLVWRRKWLRLLLIFAYLPIVFPALGIFLFEYNSADPEMIRGLSNLLRTPLFDQQELASLVMEDHDAARHQIWSTFILAFFRYPQAVAMVMLVGVIAPMMIAYDFRSKAYLMYFSRPLTPVEYIIGKSAVVWFYLAAIVTLPALGVYVLGVMVSPDLSVIGSTWDIPLRILGASVVLAVPTTAVALCFSSITAESRYTTFAWFATWIMGGVAYQILTFSGAPNQMAPPDRAERMRHRMERMERMQGAPPPGFSEGAPFPPPGRGPGRGRPEMNPEFETWLEQLDLDKWRAISPYHTLGKVEASLFDLDTTDARVWPYWLLLITVTAVCFYIIRNRIMRRLSL